MVSIDKEHAATLQMTEEVSQKAQRTTQKMKPIYHVIPIASLMATSAAVVPRVLGLRFVEKVEVTAKLAVDEEGKDL